MPASGSNSPARRAARGVTLPVRRVLDPRFADVVRRVTDITTGVTREAQQTRETLTRIGSIVSSHAEAVLELAAHVGDRLDRFDADVESIDRRIEALETEMSGTMLPGRLRTAAQSPPEQLDADAATYLDLAAGEHGPAAQAGLRVEPAVRLAHRAGGVDVAEITRAAIDEPWAVRALGGIAPDARVHVATRTPTALALTLAVLGHTVEVDGAPLVPHVGISTLAEPGTCAATVALGVLDDGDRATTLGTLRKTLAPGGALVASIRVGLPLDAGHDLLEPTAIAELFDGWTITERLDVARTSPTTWEATAAIPTEGVVLVRALPGSP